MGYAWSVDLGPEGAVVAVDVDTECAEGAFGSGTGSAWGTFPAAMRLFTRQEGD
jgi:hypothetical protein